MTPEPLVPLQQHGGAPPLYCTHALGGAVFLYLELARALGPDQPCFGLQARGLHRSEAPRTDVEEMATAYAAALRRCGAGPPWHLVGWSWGGVVALEVARRLREAGEPVGMLVLIDTLPPRGRMEPASADEVEAAFQHELGDDPAARRWSEPLRRRLLDVFSSHLHALWNYEPRPYDGMVTLLQTGEADRVASARLAWLRLCPAGLRVVPVPGDHYGVMGPPAVAHVAVVLRALVLGGA